MTAEQDVRRLRWRCRRGMRELDALLMRYLEEHYLSAPLSAQQAFEDLLSLPDPEILGLLMARSHSDDPAVDAVVDMIRARPFH